MDRRTALKKLGAGGAIAAGAPLLVSSFDVAHAASPGLPGNPPAPESGWISPNSPIAPTAYNFDIPVDEVTCSGDESIASAIIHWRIVSFSPSNFLGATTLQLRASNTVFATSTGAATTPTVRAQPVSVNGRTLFGLLDALLNGTAFTVEARIVWACGTPAQTKERTYTFSKARNTNTVVVA